MKKQKSLGHMMWEMFHGISFPYWDEVHEWKRDKLEECVMELISEHERRKREKIGVTVGKNSIGGSWVEVTGSTEYSHVTDALAERLAGRTLAPGEKVEI